MSTLALGADPIGDRMKDYEQQFRVTLPANSLAIIRLDGRAFHTWTRGLERPYDGHLVEVMAEVMIAVCQEISGAYLAISQSDEISVAFSDQAREETQLWFGGGVQKMVSVVASIATGHFARAYPDRPLAQFDARVFVLPNLIECANYFRWRQADGERNAISLLAQHAFSSQQLHGISTAQRREMLEAAGTDFTQLDPRFLRGQVAYQQTREEHVEYVDRRTGEPRRSPLVTRQSWEVITAPRLDADPHGWLLQHAAR